jgi:hypothetical protein
MSSFRKKILQLYTYLTDYNLVDIVLEYEKLSVWEVLMHASSPSQGVMYSEIKRLPDLTYGSMVYVFIRDDLLYILEIATTVTWYYRFKKEEENEIVQFLKKNLLLVKSCDDLLM